MNETSGRTGIALLAMTLGAVQASGQDALPPRFSFGGFGTFGVVHSGERRGDFTATIFKPDGAGYSRPWSADVDSLAGAQGTLRVTKKLSVVVQLVSEQNADGTYWPHVEWANAKYQLTPDFSVRVGRIVLPAFLLSDTRKVGYVTPWARPPLELYRLLPVTTSDGVDVRYSRRLGAVAHTVQGIFGRSNKDLVQDGGTARARQAWGLTYSAERGPLTARASYQHARLTITSVQPFFDALRLFGPEGVALAETYGSEAKPVSFVGFGASYDPSRWFVTTEWGHVDAHSFIGKGTAWYASGGLRRGKLTSYLVYSQARVDDLSDPGLTTTGLPPPAAGAAIGLNAGLNALLRSKADQSTTSVGGRRDLSKSTALTLQLDRTRITAGSNGVLTNVQPSFPRGGTTLYVVSAAVDVVF